jgi:hypothetical protein
VYRPSMWKILYSRRRFRTTLLRWKLYFALVPALQAAIAQIMMSRIGIKFVLEIIFYFHDTIPAITVLSPRLICVLYQPRALFINGIPYIFRCYDITQLSHRSLVNCISDDRQAKFTNPQILNVHGILKSTERHTADTQITDSADYKISAVASILQYSAACVICFISAL